MDKRVGFGMRLVAALIDAVIVVIPSALFGGMLATALGLGAGALASLLEAGGETAAAAAAMGAVAGFAIGYGLFSFLYSLIEGFKGASPGKMIAGIKIGTQDGRNAPVKVYLQRWAVKNSSTLLGTLGAFTGISLLSWLGSLAGLAVFVGCFFVLGASRQAFHDMAAKTAVYSRAELGKQEPGISGS